MQRERLAFSFWGRPFERRDYRFATNIVCDCGGLAHEKKDHSFVCSDCGAVYELIDHKFFQKKDTAENKVL
ncbi:hypothetical protein DSH72_13405 [Enterococcus faecium]|nr:hypothetical protein [Enterococcus faecium]EMF0636130.1 hypothetical protein [Enterococcus faecium]MDV4609585.1 hypothetical protein [Enterococcus faecium]